MAPPHTWSHTSYSGNRSPRNARTNTAAPSPAPRPGSWDRRSRPPDTAGSLHEPRCRSPPDLRVGGPSFGHAHELYGRQVLYRAMVTLLDDIGKDLLIEHAE